MSLVEITFLILSVIAIGSALMTVLSKNPIHSAIYLLICFSSIAGHYLLLNAQFLFIVHIIVYSGAIMVLFLTTLMLLNLNEETEQHKPAMARLGALVAAIILGLVLVAAVSKTATLMPMNNNTVDIGSIKALGKVLMDEYFYPFEFISILLLSAMVGVVLLTKKEKTTVA
ncbi:MAG: NADH-quinone oxidoreductase subunit J [Chitinophagales bacterium]|jgi:NADH-quinone oxidoreductase subunit J|nr:NADH-quinone oxidoreductase subunit J [Chitinophagales bacterium]